MKNVKKAGHLAWRTIEGKAYIVNTRTSTLHELDEVGSFIWVRIDSSPERIVDELLGEYDVTRAEAQKDLDEFLDALAEKGLIER